MIYVLVMKDPQVSIHVVLNSFFVLLLGQFIDLSLDDVIIISMKPFEHQRERIYDTTELT